MNDQATRAKLPCRDITVSYAHAGSGDPAVVSLHGSLGWRGSFAPLIPLLSTEFDVFAVDFRGHGGSTHTPGDYRLETFADDIASFIGSVVRRSAVVFGHSFGGLVGALLASFNPSPVSGLVIGDVPLSQQRLRALRMTPERLAVWRALFEHAADPAALGEALRSDDDRAAAMRTVVSPDQPDLAEFAAVLAQHDPDFLETGGTRFDDTYGGWIAEEILPKITVPVLLLQGDPAEGGLLSDADVEMALDLLPQGQHVRLDGIGHGLHEAAPQAIARYLHDFAIKLR